jgi:hypothetical protein
MAKKEAKKRIRPSDIWVIKKADFQHALDILEKAISEPFVPPKQPTAKRQGNKKRNSK